MSDPILWLYEGRYISTDTDTVDCSVLLTQLEATGADQ